MNTNTNENVRCCLTFQNEERSGRPQKKHKPASTVDTISMLTEIGISNFQLGKHDTAAKYFSQALSRFDLKSTSRTAKLKHESQDTKMYMARISSFGSTSVEIDQNNSTTHEYDEGVHLFYEPLPIAQLSSKDCIASTLFYNIGQTYVCRARYETAKNWFLRCLENSSNARSPLAVFKTLHSLGYCSYRIGQNAEALSC
jgi:tetratricopeptide (TPR) repeat protein